MHIKRLILIAVFMLVPCAQVLLLAERVNAACCPCGQCYIWCHCPGQHEYCPDSCAAPDSDLETVMSTTSTEDSKKVVGIKGIPGLVLASATTKIVSDIRRNISGKDLIRKLVELESMKYARKFSCSQAEEDYWQGTRLGLQVKAD